MRVVEEKWNKKMADERRGFYQGIEKDKKNIDSEIGVSVQLLPVELLIKHGHFELVKERALTRMWSLLLKCGSTPECRYNTMACFCRNI